MPDFARPISMTPASVRLSAVKLSATNYPIRPTGSIEAIWSGS